MNLSQHPRRVTGSLVAATLVFGACSSTTTTADDTQPAPAPATSPADNTPTEPRPAADQQAWPQDGDWFTTGFLDFPIEWSDSPDMEAGFSMYVAAWPFQATYPGPSYQTGLPSTWLTATESDGAVEAYSTIEGGLGWWNDTRFATETPKFIMGGVSRDFDEWANGPGAGSGADDSEDRRDWDLALGKYGVAQLSPNVLWAPDGLNLAEGTNGELFGYGYHPLPLIDEQLETAGQDITTGNRSWTLFLNTDNFSGPVSFFIPNFFSKPALDDPAVEGQFFDSNGTDPHRFASMETQVIPSAYATDANGTSYARITRTQFPASTSDSSIILNQVASYSDDAIWQGTTDWFDNGDAPSDLLSPASTEFSQFDKVDAVDTSSYTIIYEGMNEAEEYPIDWAMLASPDTSDPLTFRFRWNLDQVRLEGDSFVLPEYYRLDDTADGNVWRPVADADVPDETGLADHVFDELGLRNDTEPYATPDDPDSIWQSPGPVSGPLQAELGDGSIVTYSWYRFVDQPAIQHWGFSDDQLGALQGRVEDIHREWGPDRTYLAPPSTGELASLDPAIIVNPPAGMEVGYVPIVTRQERSES